MKLNRPKTVNLLSTFKMTQRQKTKWIKMSTSVTTIANTPNQAAII